jgi:hypothetical protein
VTRNPRKTAFEVPVREDAKVFVLHSLHHQSSKVATVHQMPRALVPPVEPDDVARLEVLHEGTEIGVGCFDHHVGMVACQAIEVQDHAVAQNTGVSASTNPVTVIIIAQNGLPHRRVTWYRPPSYWMPSGRAMASL